NILGNIYERRTALRDECGRELATCPISDVECAAVCVKNVHGALHNESMQLVRSNCSAERFAQPVEEIENEGHFDLNLLMRALQFSNSPRLDVGSHTPPC